VDDPDAVVGEVAGFVDRGPEAGGQAPDDVLQVRLVAVGAGRVLGVGDVQDQSGDPRAELVAEDDDRAVVPGGDREPQCPSTASCSSAALIVSGSSTP